MVKTKSQWDLIKDHHICLLYVAASTSIFFIWMVIIDFEKKYYSLIDNF